MASINQQGFHKATSLSMSVHFSHVILISKSSISDGVRSQRTHDVIITSLLRQATGLDA